MPALSSAIAVPIPEKPPPTMATSWSGLVSVAVVTVGIEHSRAIRFSEMDPGRAKELLARERNLVEGELSSLLGEGTQEGDDRVEPGDYDSEALYQDEFDAG